MSSQHYSNMFSSFFLKWEDYKTSTKPTNLNKYLG